MDLRPCSVDQKPVRSSHTLGVGYCCNKPRAQPPTRARKGCILDNYNRINKLASGVSDSRKPNEPQPRYIRKEQHDR